jgi:outer membrane biosynthesis protein TonB
MAAQAQQAKVLRIGIIQDGKIVQERLIKAGETVQVGESPKNTFVFPKTALNRPEFPLFVAKGGQYQLQFTEEMKGKISSGGAVVALEKLRTDPSVQNTNGVWKLPLSDQDRGKIGIDNVTVLFQFVPPPPVQASKPLERMDFRAAWLEEDDPAFLGFLALFTALAVVFSVGLYLAPRPPEPEFRIDDRFVRMVVQEVEKKEKKEEEKEKEKQEDLNAQKTEAEKKEQKAEEPDQQVNKEPPKNKVDAAKQKEDRKAALRNKMRIANIGTTGRGSGTTTDAWEGGLLNDLSGLKGSDVAVGGDPKGTRGGNTTGAKDIEVDGDVKVGQAGSSKGGDVPAVDMSKYSAEALQGDTMDVEGADNVESVVRKFQGQLTYCYEAELRADPSLEGRIEVRFNIANKRVTQANVVSNSTGNDQLAACVVSKVKRWQFSEEVTGSVTWPFNFRKR